MVPQSQCSPISKSLEGAHKMLENSFNQLVEEIRNQLKPDEQFTLTLDSEQSQFTRFNHAKVRQTGTVNDGGLQLVLMHNQRSSYREFPFTGDTESDRQTANDAIAALREEVSQLPENPYLVLPRWKQYQSRSSYRAITRSRCGRFNVAPWGFRSRFYGHLCSRIGDSCVCRFSRSKALVCNRFVFARLFTFYNRWNKQ